MARVTLTTALGVAAWTQILFRLTTWRRTLTAKFQFSCTCSKLRASWGGSRLTFRYGTLARRKPSVMYLIIPFAFFNMVAFLLNMPFTETVFTVPLVSDRQMLNSQQMLTASNVRHPECSKNCASGFAFLGQS